MKTWKPVAAGILNILSAVLWIGSVLFIALLTLGLSVGFGSPIRGWGLVRVWTTFGVLMIPPAISVIGGIFSLRRRRWRLALAGAICAMPVFLGFASAILLILSKDEFQTTGKST
ncbi:hypothetical protein [Dehalogenimonas etheniformans]|uniref:Uncharacterized protein n=1 Tax=Dehalogenimonas etheniformans TaxID=1536648 RepID=A0A2P5P809_9CHLR|nr:hypothetical protein [Dehalogenimonas etheniformans]PPD58443.1 hypothetical protein JP09_004165 [Dehalogenimonas etheniformans]QNT75873.1 hypothetical protein HX448_03810 [Dehalogenimonas etheniformans]